MHYEHFLHKIELRLLHYDSFVDLQWHDGGLVILCVCWVCNNIVCPQFNMYVVDVVF